MRLAGGRFESVLRFRIGRERLTLLDPDRAQQVDHRLVALQPRLVLHHAVERSEKPHIVGNRRIEDDIDHVVKDGRRRVGGLRQWVELDLFAVSNRLGDVLASAPFDDRTEQRMAL